MLFYANRLIRVRNIVWALLRSCGTVSWDHQRDWHFDNYREISKQKQIHILNARFDFLINFWSEFLKKNNEELNLKILWSLKLISNELRRKSLLEDRSDCSGSDFDPLDPKHAGRLAFSSGQNSSSYRYRYVPQHKREGEHDNWKRKHLSTPARNGQGRWYRLVQGCARTRQAELMRIWAGMGFPPPGKLFWVVPLVACASARRQNALSEMCAA